MNPYHDIAAAFSVKPLLTRNELKNHFRTNNPSLKDSSLDWLVYNLNRKHIIQRTRYDRYQLGVQNVPLREYKPNLSETASAVLTLLDDRYPQLTFIVWETFAFNAFANHQMVTNYIIVEVEKPLDESVFYTLRRENPCTVLYRPDEKERNLYSEDVTIVVLPLTSEAPIDGHHARLEKLLVDLFANKLLDGVVSRSDYPGIFDEAFTRYSINYGMLLRYAARRSKRDEIERFLNDKTSINAARREKLHD